MKNSIKFTTIIRKFIDLIDISDYEIETDTGWHPISKIGKTRKYDVWYLELQNGLTLRCADDHIVFDDEFEQIYTKDLIVGVTKVMTRYGASLVTKCYNTFKKEHMYDVQVDSNDHRYYSDDILSHNTTISSVYILHYILFNADKTVAILANKESTATEVLSRIKIAYLNLPYFLQQGIKYAGWNTRSLYLENGSKIVTGTTSSSSIRSKSISLLYIDEYAHIPDHLVKEFQESVFPTIYSSPSSRIIVVSTPKGLNHFYDVYTNAVKGKNSFYPIKINWWDVPGRDNAFKNNIIQDFGKIHWEQEYACFEYNSNINIEDGGEKSSIKIGELYEKIERENNMQNL